MVGLVILMPTEDNFIFCCNVLKPFDVNIVENVRDASFVFKTKTLNIYA